MITVEKATRNLQRKIRKVSSEALPDLLFIGTRNRSGAGRLDRVIDGLEQRLCKAMEQGYPKIAAAAIIEKRRSREPVIVAVAKAMAKGGASNPPAKSDLDRPTMVQKVEPLTDTKSAARARRKANKNKLKAQQAEASAAEARENLNKGAEMDTMITIAKSVIAGKPSTFTKRDFFVELQKRADQQRRPNESRAASFTRLATADPDGRLLMQAHKAAGGDDYSGEPDKPIEEPVTNEAYQRLMDLAAKERRESETVEQCFSRLHADPKYRNLVATEKRMHNVRVAKALGLG